MNADGSFTYTHNGGETTTDAFTYKVNDGTVDGNTVTVSITITVVPVNNAPIAVADTYTVNEGATLTINAALGVLNNDTDSDGDPITSILVSSVSNGTLTLNADGSFTYTHNGSKTLNDSFTYKVNDGKIDGNTVTVAIIITNHTVNHIPIAVLDSASTTQEKAVTISVLSNDTGLEDGISIHISKQPTNGTVVVNSDSTITYKPNNGYSGNDEFVYQICDTNGDCAEAIVSIKVNAVIFVPDGFSPNADGINDYFEIPELKSYTNVNIQIFNRWGSVVYENNNYKNNWDGKANKASLANNVLPAGTYFYIIKLSNPDRQLNGYVYINR